MSADSEEPMVLYRGVRVRLPRRQVERFARELRRRIARKRGFVCLITQDRELRRLNRQFLSRDYATDVLSFPGACGAPGEMAISAQRAAVQAREHGHTVADEICVLMLHGVLHLAGMDHETDGGCMARAEVRWRKKLGLPSGLMERVRA
jgi:probable rRNA maturation factor